MLLLLLAGIILDGLLAVPEGEGRAFDTVVYIGDGGGDYCPALRLRYFVVLPVCAWNLHTLMFFESGNVVVNRTAQWGTA